MYVYAFDRWYGQDRVAVLQGASCRAGDLLQQWTEYFLALGEEASFSELSSQFVLRLDAAQVCIPQLLGEASLSFLHWFVNQWLTTYKQAVPLWLGSNVEQLFLRMPSRLHKSKPAPWLRAQVANDTLSMSLQTAAWGQQLVVFPNIFSLETAIDGFEMLESCVVLTSHMTTKQAAERFWSVKQGKAKTVLCTYSQIFQDWHNLESIVLTDQHTRYYKQQQDPRYHILPCVSYLQDLHHCQVQSTGRALDAAWEL